MSNAKMTWFEVPAEDAERARAFYGGLFGWRFQAFDATCTDTEGNAFGLFEPDQTS